MPKTLSILGTDFNFPVAGEDPNWGTEAVDWAEAVTNALTLITSVDDILPTAFVIDNNISVPTEIRGLFFNPLTVRAVNVQYTVARSVDGAEIVESGEILLNHNTEAAPGSQWQMTLQVNGDAQIILSVDDTGQFYYISSNFAGADYSGSMRFSAKTLGKV